VILLALPVPTRVVREKSAARMTALIITVIIFFLF